MAVVVLLSLSIAVATVPAAAVFPAENPDPSNGIAPAVASDTSNEAGDASRQELTGSFSQQLYTGIAGDPVEIDYTADNSDGDVYLLIGGNRLTDTGESVGFVDVINVSDSSSGTFRLNTRLIGTDQGPENSCSNTDCDLEFRDEDGNEMDLEELSASTGAGGLPRPLIPQRYRLAVTNGTFIVQDSGVVVPTEVGAESDLVLEKPTFHDEAEVFVTSDPERSSDGGNAESLSGLRDNGADQSVVTKGDRVVLGFESTGIWGALSHFAEDRTDTDLKAGEEVDHRVLSDLLEAEEGVTLRVRQTNPDRNEPRSELDLSNADPDDVTLLLADAEETEKGSNDPTAGRFYLILDTDNGTAFTEDPEPGDEFAVEFALEGTEGDAYEFAETQEPPGAFTPRSSLNDGTEEQFPYWNESDGRVATEASFRVGERALHYDHLTDDGDILVEAEEKEITGETSMLPQTEMSATFTADDRSTPSRAESELEISDTNFTIDVGVENATPGSTLNYRLQKGSSLWDSRTVIVVEDAEDPDRLQIEKATTDLTVTRGESLSNLSTTVRNVGALETQERLTLDVGDGAIVERRQVSVDVESARNETFEDVDADLEPGEYPYTLEIDDSRVRGTLTVESDSTENDTGGVSDDSDDTAPDGSTDENGSSQSDTTDDASANDTTDDASTNDTTDDASTNDTTDDASTNDTTDDASTNDTTDDASANDTTDDSTDGASKNDTEDGEPEDSPEDDSESATIVPVPFGTREAFSGTVIVGGMYVLGHWV